MRHQASRVDLAPPSLVGCILEVPVDGDDSIGQVGLAALTNRMPELQAPGPCYSLPRSLVRRSPDLQNLDCRSACSRTAASIQSASDTRGRDYWLALSK